MVNGGNRKREADYGESSPHFRGSASWSDYMEPYEKFSYRIHQVSSGRSCNCVCPRRP